MALDWGILHWIQNNITCPFLDAVVPKLTMLGNAGIIWILAGVLLLCTKKYRRQGALVLMGLLAGLLVGNVALKHLVARSRPCWLDPSVQLLIATPTDYSFPSGHTLSSTIAATILAKTDRRFGYAAISLAVLNQLLIRSGREDQAMMTTLAGLVVVLSILVKQISALFVTIKSLFAL